VAFGLAPLADDAARRGDEHDATALNQAVARLRHGVRELRSLLVEIHPPNLESTGIEAALNDLLSPLDAAGIATELHVDGRATAGSEGDALVYRVAREAVRNVQAHAAAASTRVELTRPTRGTTRLVVEDDGRGFAADERERRAGDGHVGLTLMESLVREAGGTLRVRSKPGEGTTVEMEMPA
jgi:signal transduction histidine kinase